MNIDTLETIKLNAKTGRFLFILDTINELTDAEIREAIGDNFRLLRVSLIDEAKQIIAHLNKEVTDELVSRSSAYCRRLHFNDVVAVISECLAICHTQLLV